MTQQGIYRIFRLGGILGIAVVALLFPSLGENRFWLAGILVFVCIPLATYLELRYPAEETAWSWPFFDVTMVVLLINLVPESWILGLLIGAVVVGSAGTVARRIGMRSYVALAAILIGGMSITAIIHGVDNWFLPIAILCAILPTMIFYVSWEGMRSNLLHHRSESLRGLTLVAGGVAHDFNNLLTIICGNAHLARDNADTTSSEELDAVIDAADQARVLTQQLLAFSGANLDARESIDLEVEVNAMRRLLEKALPSGSTLNIGTTDGPYLVVCQHAELQQVIMNIIINASEASKPDPAEITLRLSREGSPDGKSWVQLEIQDRGAGIPADLLPRIFEPFVSSKPTGYGLGLVSAERILKHYGGDITVDSKEDVGTTVRLRLPAQAEETAGRVADDFRNPMTSSGLVLVVDDDPQIRKLVCRQLQPLGYDTITAADGAQALQRFEEHPETTAVVLDLKMPVMDGWQCLSAIRAVKPEIPVIIMSGYNPDYSANFADYPDITVLAKPFQFEALSKALSAINSTPT